MTGEGAIAPLFGVHDPRGEAANLICHAQLTPFQRVQLENRRRALVRASRPPPKVFTLDRVERLVRNALDKGYRPERMLAGHWDISGDCQSSKVVELYGRQTHSVFHENRKEGGRVRTLWLHVRCRRCPACLQKRRNLWAYRAQNEIAMSVRTWMATFTWSPHEHARMRMAASRRLARGSVDLELLPQAEQTVEVSANTDRSLRSISSASVRKRALSSGTF